MATSLSELRKSRSSMLDKIVKDLDSGGKRNTEDDSRFWKLNRDKAGNGSAIIRFLPPVNGDELPWVKTFSYGFQGQSGKWYINESPSTIGLPDPVMEYNAAAYASKDEERIEDAKKRKRRTQFISNIYVVKDPANPENEGKVFLFKYGKKIHDLIVSKAKPEFDSEDPIYVWDLWEGCNLKLRIKTVSGYPNYDSSEWTGQGPLLSDDDHLQKIVDTCHKLAEFIDPSRFKPYEKLSEEFNRAMSLSGSTQTAEAKARKELDEDLAFDLDAEVKKAAETQPRKVEKKAAVVEDDEDDLESFKKMLDDL